MVKGDYEAIKELIDRVGVESFERPVDVYNIIVALLVRHFDEEARQLFDQKRDLVNTVELNVDGLEGRVVQHRDSAMLGELMQGNAQNALGLQKTKIDPNLVMELQHAWKKYHIDQVIEILRKMGEDATSNPQAVQTAFEKAREIKQQVFNRIWGEEFSYEPLNWEGMAREEAELVEAMDRAYREFDYASFDTTLKGLAGRVGEQSPHYGDVRALRISLDVFKADLEQDLVHNQERLLTAYLDKGVMEDGRSFYQTKKGFTLVGLQQDRRLSKRFKGTGYTLDAVNIHSRRFPVRDLDPNAFHAGKVIVYPEIEGVGPLEFDQVVSVEQIREPDELRLDDGEVISIPAESLMIQYISDEGEPAGIRRAFFDPSRGLLGQEIPDFDEKVARAVMREVQNELEPLLQGARKKRKKLNRSLSNKKDPGGHRSAWDYDHQMVVLTEPTREGTGSALFYYQSRVLPDGSVIMYSKGRAFRLDDSGEVKKYSDQAMLAEPDKMMGVSEQGTASSVTPTGGIDLTPAAGNLQIRRGADGVPLPVEMQDIPNIDVDGFYPVILDMVPFVDVPMIFSENEEEDLKVLELSRN